MTRWMRFAAPNSLLAKLRSALGGKVGAVVGMAVVGGCAFGLGRSIGLGAAGAQQQIVTSAAVDPSKVYDPEYVKRVVAFIHGNVPIYRAELAEFLIARYGAEQLGVLVNQKIVERACKAKGVDVTDAEVEIEFQRGLQGMSAKMFEENFLRKIHMKTYQFKEDVIRTKIALAKLVATEVVVTREDLEKGFEILYGPKVQCRWITFMDSATARAAWQRLRESVSLTDAFLAEAKQQFDGHLASKAGEIDPIHKHFGDPNIEKEAFRLRPGEMSQVIDVKGGLSIILLCERHLPADATKSFEKEQIALYNDVRQEKVAKLAKARAEQIRQAAAPRTLLSRQPGIEQIYRETEGELGNSLNFRGADPK
jgi:parvulin-like peptidyl-prolyl isomerase